MTGLHPLELQVLVEEISVSDGKFNLFYSDVLRELDRVFQPLAHCLREVLGQHRCFKGKV